MTIKPRKVVKKKTEKRAPKSARGKAPVDRKKPPRKRPPPHPISPDAPAENPRARALAERIAALTLDKKASDVVILDVRGMTSYADYFVLASGESDRQVSAMAEHVETTLKSEGTRPVGTEGYDTGNWVLLDYGEVVGHLFFTEVRSFYDLEGLWADARKEKVA